MPVFQLLLDLGKTGYRFFERYPRFCLVFFYVLASSAKRCNGD